MVAIALKGRAGRPRRAKTAKPAGSRRVPWGLAGAWAAFALALGGTGAWLALSGEEAAATWEAQIPHVTVRLGAPAAGEAKPAAPGAEKAAPPAKAAEGHPPAAHSAEAPPPTEAPAPEAAPPAPSVADPNAPVTLTPAPAAGLIEETKAGPLPRIATDGRKPWQVYARPFPTGVTKPKIAIVLTDLGISGVVTNNAIDKLPPAVSLAFAPTSERLDSWVDRARGAGHEVLLTIPMEPLDFPKNDPGPDALFTLLKPERNAERLEKWLTHGIGFIGVTTSSGVKFMTNARALQAVMEVLGKRGLMFVDPRLTPESAGLKQAREQGVPVAAADRVIDSDLSRGAIDDQLKELETAAKKSGSAVGFGFPYPNTVERVTAWAIGLADRGFVLAPVSAVATVSAATAPPPAASTTPAPEGSSSHGTTHH